MRPATGAVELAPSRRKFVVVGLLSIILLNIILVIIYMQSIDTVTEFIPETYLQTDPRFTVEELQNPQNP
ncbi:MAG: hypothetical protein ACE5DX_03005 [Candidatus Dojkabacteria bacterium]